MAGKILDHVIMLVKVNDVTMLVKGKWCYKAGEK